jgi:integrase
MQDAWNTFASRLRTKLEAIKEPVPDYTFDELVVYLRDYKRRKPATIAKRLSQLAFMESHGAMPVQLHSGRYAIVNSFYLYVRYRETVEGAKATALINDHKAIRALGDFLGIPREVWPTAPTEPKTDERSIPSPEDIYELLHADYTPNASSSYNNALLKALLVLDFGFGLRTPSEPHALKLKDFRPDRHILVVTEPKKSLRRRTILVEPEWMCCSPRHPSLANYLVWRDKVDPERRQEAFFLKADGKPFPSKYALNKFLKDHVQPRFPWFYSYLGRHWCANARLIEWGYDYARVADWLGHETVDMTRREYEHNARLHERLYGKDWLARIARKGRSDKGQARTAPQTD